MIVWVLATNTCLFLFIHPEKFHLVNSATKGGAANFQIRFLRARTLGEGLDSPMVDIVKGNLVRRLRKFRLYSNLRQ